MKTSQASFLYGDLVLLKLKRCNFERRKFASGSMCMLIPSDCLLPPEKKKVDFYVL